MIYELVEDEDFVEIILNKNELEKVAKNGVVKNFQDMLHKNRNTNVFVRIDKEQKK